MEIKAFDVFLMRFMPSRDPLRDKGLPKLVTNDASDVTPFPYVEHGLKIQEPFPFFIQLQNVFHQRIKMAPNVELKRLVSGRHVIRR